MSLINDTLNFLDNTHSQFHAIASVKSLLLENGYVELNENKPFNLETGKKYFVTRNGSSLIAFNVNDSRKFHIVATHSDSPTFKLKPEASLVSPTFSKLSTEGYGGMIISTWLDRPLSIAGRVFVKSEEGLKETLVDIDEDLCIIPNVCIHFNRNINDGYTYNKAVDTLPVVTADESFNLNAYLAAKLEVNPEDILGHDLYLYNRDRSKFIGPNKELFAAAKIDNLECTYLGLRSFIETDNEDAINVLAVFDNEEVGSGTAQGADSTFLDDVLFRISYSLGFNGEEYKIALANSFLVSADNAHALHPNHPELSDALNRPLLNKGIAIKFNAAQSYTSDGLSSAIFKNILDNANVPYQNFTNRSDIRGGGTLGNISTSHVSIPSVDIGCAQLAMHSAYETAGTKDIENMFNAMRAFYKAKF